MFYNNIHLKWISYSYILSEFIDSIPEVEIQHITKSIYDFNQEVVMPDSEEDVQSFLQSNILPELVIQYVSIIY